MYRISLLNLLRRVTRSMPYGFRNVSLRVHGLFRQSLNGTGTGTGTSIMLIPSHCNGSGTRTGNLCVCLHVLNRDPNVPCGFVYINLGNDVMLV